MEIDSRLHALDPKSERYRVLAAARDFRASWVQLGELLTDVRENDLFQQWGYDSFEAYCRRELRLRRDTALKLTRSFSFLRDHEPQVLAEQPLDERQMPSLDVVDLLSRARERAQISDDQLASIQEEVFSPDGPQTRSQVVRRFREVDPEAFKGPERGPRKVVEGVAPVSIDLRKALLLAERLEGLLLADDQAVPGVQQAIQSVVQNLRQRFKSAGSEPQQQSA